MAEVSSEGESTETRVGASGAEVVDQEPEAATEATEAPEADGYTV